MIYEKLDQKNDFGHLVGDPSVEKHLHRLMVQNTEFIWKPFDNAGNQNIYIARVGGLGISLVAADLVCHAVTKGKQVWIISLSNDYKFVCKLLHGEFIDVAKRQLCFNPFSTATDLEALSDFMVPLLALSVGLGPYRIKALDYLRNAVGAVWESQGQQGSIHQIAQWLSHQSSKGATLAAALYPYTNQGQYAYYFNGLANMAFNAPVVNFCLPNQGRFIFSNTILMLLLIHHAYANPQTVVVLDAAMNYFRLPYCQAILENLFKKANNHQGVMIFVADDLQERLVNTALETIYKRCYWKVFLCQGAQNIQRLAKYQVTLNQTEQCFLTLNHHPVIIKGNNGESAAGCFFERNLVVL